MRGDRHRRASVVFALVGLVGAVLGGCADRVAATPVVDVPSALDVSPHPVEVAFDADDDARWSLRHYPSMALECELPCTRVVGRDDRLVLYRAGDDGAPRAIRVPALGAEAEHVDMTALPARGSPGVPDALATAAVIPVLIGTAGLLALIAGPPRNATPERASAADTTAAVMTGTGFGTGLVLGGIAIGYGAYYRSADRLVVRSRTPATTGPQVVFAPTGLAGTF